MIDVDAVARAVGNPESRELAVLRAFVASHPLRSLDLDGAPVRYLRGGVRSPTLVTFTGAHSVPESAYRSVLTYEGDARVIVAAVGGFANGKALARGVDRVLDEEDAGRIVVLGISLAGIVGQLYLRHRPERVAGLVLVHTLAPHPERGAPAWLQPVIRFAPIGLIRKIFRRKLLRAFDIEPPPELADRLSVARALAAQAIHRDMRRDVLRNVLALCRELDLPETNARTQRWRGPVLIVSSDDDPARPDVELLQRAYPQGETLLLPTGAGHLAPMVHAGRLEARVRSLLGEVGRDV